MDSTRFPGKALCPLNGKASFQRVIERIKLSKTVDKIIAAVPNTKENDVLQTVCDKLQIACYRGDMDDVLGRVLAAVESKSDDTIIVDITADCPLVDPIHIDWCVNKVRKGNDYASNVCKRTWPDGFDVQAYKKKTLRYITGIVTNPKHRSHVGWNILAYHKYAAYKMKLANLGAPLGYALPRMGLTLDEEKDKELLSNIFEHFDNIKGLSCLE